MSIDDEIRMNSESAKTYKRNMTGIAFFTVHMFLVTLSVLVVANVKLTICRDWIDFCYLMLSSLHLITFPLTLMMIIQPLFTPWRQVIAGAYFLHMVAIMTLVIISDEVEYIIIGIIMALFDLPISLALIVGYEGNEFFRTILTFRLRDDPCGLVEHQNNHSCQGEMEEI